jgi:hypothetical protein
MATARPFAYNPGSPIAGTEQLGDLAVGTPDGGFTNNPQFWNGPDEELGYTIALPVPNNTQPTPLANYLYLDPSHKGGDVNLSNNNQTVHQQFGYQQSVLGVNQIKSTDKIMFSVLVSLAQPSTQTDSHFIGIGYQNMNYQGNPYGGFPGNDGLSVGYRSNGTIWYNGAQYASGLESWGDDDVIDIAIDNSSNTMWVRVNNGDWNNNPSDNPATGSGGVEIINGPFYPVLCPGYEGTMTIQNNAAYGTPNNFRLLGDETASVRFMRSGALTEESFLGLVNTQFGQNFNSGGDAKVWLDGQGYWSSWSGFGSSGFQWMTMTDISDTTAAGIGQNSVTVAITQSEGGMQIENPGMYEATTFPETYGVPVSGIQIRNTLEGVFTATFSQPVTDPLVAFASVGNPNLPVPVQVSAPFTPIWDQPGTTTYQNASGPTQYTQFTGQEGFNIIRIDGTVSSVSFNYTVPEFYCTICFGFVDQNT